MLYLLLSINDMVNTKGSFSKTHHRKDKFGSEVEPFQTRRNFLHLQELYISLQVFWFMYLAFSKLCFLPPPQEKKKSMAQGKNKQTATEQTSLSLNCK